MTLYSRDINILSLGMLVVVWYGEVMGHASVLQSYSVRPEKVVTIREY
jgi:hypothetical protein